MRYIALTAPGDAEVMQLAERDLPAHAAGQVLIKVKAAGVNRLDILQRQGKYPPPPGASDILGLEVAGDIVAIGDDVTTFRPGDAVCALMTGGGYAEYASAEASLCLPIPDALSYSEAAALPEALFTIWSNVIDRAGLKAGERFLVHGGSSGIGSIAIQLAKALGATVFTTAGSAEKCRACIGLGADLAINYHEDDFVEQIKQATQGEGVHVILDMVLGDYLQKNIRLAAEEGRLVIIAGLKGYTTKVNLLPVMQKRLLITGSTLRGREVAFKAAIARKIRQYVWPWVESGQIRPVIYQEFALAEAAAAHHLMQSSQHIGKIILNTA